MKNNITHSHTKKLRNNFLFVLLCCYRKDKLKRREQNLKQFKFINDAFYRLSNALF